MELLFASNLMVKLLLLARQKFQERFQETLKLYSREQKLYKSSMNLVKRNYLKDL